MKKKNRSFPKKSALLLTAAALLLIGSTVGSTRAALTYYSENYSAQVEMSKIGVTLLENGEAVSHRNYEDNGEWAEEQNGKLLENLLKKDEKFTPGKQYEEKLSVQNSGSIDSFVRVILKKSWVKDGRPETTLSPDWIELKLADGGWVVDERATTDERMILYYPTALAPGETTPALSETIRINEKIAEKVTKKVEGNTIRYVYDYDGYTFTLDAEVNAVQTHNAQEAIKSAWGVDVTADETSMSLQ